MLVRLGVMLAAGAVLRVAQERTARVRVALGRKRLVLRLTLVAGSRRTPATVSVSRH